MLGTVNHNKGGFGLIHGKIGAFVQFYPIIVKNYPYTHTIFIINLHLN